MRGAQPSLCRSTASSSRSYIVPPSTIMASAFWSGSSETSHEPSRGNVSALRRRRSAAATSAPRARKRSKSRTSGPKLPRGRQKGNFQSGDFRLQIADLPFNQSHVPGPRTFLRFLDGELDPLAFPKQLEHRAANGAAMKDVLQAGFITNDPEALVDKELCDRPGRHSLSSDKPRPERSRRLDCGHDRGRGK